MLFTEILNSSLTWKNLHNYFLNETDEEILLSASSADRVPNGIFEKKIEFRGLYPAANVINEACVKSYRNLTFSVSQFLRYTNKFNHFLEPINIGYYLDCQQLHGDMLKKLPYSFQGANILQSCIEKSH